MELRNEEDKSNEDLLVSQIADPDNLNGNDDEFEGLPLKGKVFKSINFPELDDYWDSTPGTPFNVKKVRFDNAKDSETNDEREDSGKDAAKSKNDSNGKGKKHVEELIQYANQVNDYLEHNIEKINSFRSDTIVNEDGSLPLSNAATECSSVWESVSNFELSEGEFDEKDRSNSELFNLSLRSDTLQLTRSRDQQNERFNIDKSLSQYYRERNRADSDPSCTLENSPVLDQYEKPEVREDILEATPIIDYDLEDVKFAINHPNFADEHHREVEHNHLVLPNGENQRNIADIEHLSVEDAINNFVETINLIMQISAEKSEEYFVDIDDSNQDSCSDFLSPFAMKSTPTVTFKEFLNRIQSKCMFGQIIYLGSAYLLQLLLLDRDSKTSKIKLRHHFNIEHVHRLIIATIRVATKLLEDFVHSHGYMSKVCGISRKLLTKLEVFLLISVNDNGMFLSYRELIASLLITEELRELSR